MSNLSTFDCYYSRGRKIDCWLFNLVVTCFPGGGGGGANGEMANLTNEKGKVAIAIFRHR